MGRILALAAVAAATTLVATAAQARHDRETAKPLPGLPAATAGYRGWERLNRRPIPPRAADAHRGTKNVFANKRIRTGRYPYGTVIVKEITRPGGGFVDIVAVMQKLRGRAPSENDWVMVEYERGSPRSRFEAFAGGGLCTSCHVRAKANDYVFTRRVQR